ncbi:Vacuolar protein sorting/targeting protein 10 [Thelohanellus kitauei]|uniref:Vacuolar protein sorting/targeting protein 10 n=1 Tax=Thelohanellus kitauei TaxID=669202 RepID=A0A0C2N929_THEKT|nr:Vacuolar protein sorting/targeting protein 10 [Thelohanellus kitauei]
MLLGFGIRHGSCISVSNNTVRIQDVSNNFTEIDTFYNIKKFVRIRNDFILLVYDQNTQKDPKIGILHLDKSDHNTIKIIHIHRSEMSGLLASLNRYKEYFYYHGNHYLLAGTSASLCLCTINRYSELVRLVCNLRKYTEYDGKCSFVVNPHLPGIIYANLNKNKRGTRTYVSFDNGKNFIPLKFKSNKCHTHKCGVELDIKCSFYDTNYHFPEKWIVTFDGKIHSKGFASRHIFISFDGGKNWKILSSRIENLTILNGGGLLYGIERNTHKIWYSFNEGLTWYKNNVSTHDVIAIKPFDSPRNRIVAVINYNGNFKTSSLYLYNFSSIINLTCQRDDYETWYIQRYFRNCFQGQEISYFKKKHSSICFDNRSQVLPTIKQCHCSLEDFHCKQHYLYDDGVCKLDPVSNFTESNKTCRDGGIPLIRRNGFAQLDSKLCSPKNPILNQESEYADYCVSHSILKVDLDYTVRIFASFKDSFKEWLLDYKGHYIPAAFIKTYLLPRGIRKNDVICYDKKGKAIYLSKNRMIYRYNQNKGRFKSSETSLYRLGFHIVSMAFDSSNSLLIILDNYYRLFVISIEYNYIKLLSGDVTDFQYHSNYLYILI